MRKIAYWLCFTLVAAPAVLGTVGLLLHLAGIAMPFPPSLFVIAWFGSLVPQPLAPWVPAPVTALLGLVMLLLVLRRIWRFLRKGERTPASFRGFPLVLGYIGAISLALALVVLLLSIVLRAGSGVPAGMLLLPAVLCVPWAFFLTEALSFRKASGNHEPTGEAVPAKT